jgi:hypothetical protein
MFFRREKPHQWTFDERLENVRKAGFTVETETPGRARVSRDGCAAVIEDRPADRPHVNQAGVLIGNEIGLLVNGGYQMFLRAPSGRIAPARAVQLKALHEFEEDLKEALGLVSLYNESLGTTSDQHLYDRILNRDRGVPKRPWDDKLAVRSGS